MRKVRWLPASGLVLLVGLQIGGCTNLLPTIPLEIKLGSSSSFDTTSGVPAAKTFTSNFTNDSGLEIGRGTLEIDPDAIDVTPDQSKTTQAIPIPETCGAACSAAGVEGPLCTEVCNAGSVVVRVWVSLADEADPQQTGDEYGPYTVELDGEANPISVDPPTVELQEETIQAINAGSAKVTVEIISPYDGTVTLNALVVNAGL